MGTLNRACGVERAGSTVRREIIAGATTFFTMSYIFFD